MAAVHATLADDQPMHHRRHHDRPFGVSVNLTHAKVAREPKPPAPRTPPAKPKQPMRQVAPPPPIVQPSLEIPGRVLAIMSSYDDLHSAVRARVCAMRLTYEAVDHLSGSQSGYTGKLLSPNQLKRFGKLSLGDTLGALGLYLALVESPEQVAKLKAVAAALDALGAVAALGVTMEEFERVAGSVAEPPKKSLALLDQTLARSGCRLALVENPETTAAIEANASKRERPLREVKPTAARNV
jgi:hypothetical protein